MAILTDVKIRSLKPSEKCTSSRPDKHSDQEGLQLWVRSSGTKTWISAYRFNKKQQNLTLGSYPDLRLSEARQANKDIKALLAEGIDPKTQKRRQKIQDYQSQQFNDYALVWLAERNTTVKPRTYQQDSNRMHKDVLPMFKDIALKNVSFDDCKLMAEQIEARKDSNGQPPREVTRRTIALVEKIMKRAKMERLIESNPIEGLKDLYPKAKTQHMKHVDLSELPQLLRDIENYSYET